MSAALLFPGQGSQQDGMLHRLPDTPASRAVVDESRSVCAEFGLTGELDNPGALADTTGAQLALLAAGVACARALTEDAGLDFGFVAGHSVGSFAAAVTAGVLTLREALHVVHARGQAMAAACAAGQWGMAAITGLPVTRVQAMTQQTATPTDPLWIANINTATQTVVGGTVGAMSRAEAAARTAGATDFIRLNVAIASHGPIQDNTVTAVQQALATVPRRPVTAGYLTNSRGRCVRSAPMILDDLASSVARPVRWYDGIRLFAELGVTCTVETLPGHTLTKLTSASTRDVSTLALADDSWDAVVSRVRRHT